MEQGFVNVNIGKLGVNLLFYYSRLHFACKLPCLLILAASVNFPLHCFPLTDLIVVVVVVVV